MAAFAQKTEFAVMYIILSMTSGTFKIHLHFFSYRLVMAIIAFDLSMLSFQLEFCLVMIKIPHLPVTRVMT